MKACTYVIAVATITLLFLSCSMGRLSLMDDNEVQNFEKGITLTTSATTKLLKEHVKKTHSSPKKPSKTHRRQQQHYCVEEILAQSACTSLASDKKLKGLFYAVGRDCSAPDSGTCNMMCSNATLGGQDMDTRTKTWSCYGAYYIYDNRPPTNVWGTIRKATLGLKTRHESCSRLRCGPNFCCCRAV